MKRSSSVITAFRLQLYCIEYVSVLLINVNSIRSDKRGHRNDWCKDSDVIIIDWVRVCRAAELHKLVCHDDDDVDECLSVYRDGISGGAAPLFFSMPCRDNIESLLHQHIGPFTATSPPAAPPPVPSRSSAFCADTDVDDVIKAQFCAAAAAAAAAAGQNRG